MDFVDIIKLQEWFDVELAKQEADSLDDKLNNPKDHQ
jgi:acyl carrier protein